MNSPHLTAGYQDAIDFLLGRLNYELAVAIPYQERHLKLQRMQRILDLLGNPERRLNILHVAGSKGKGSTVTTLARLLEAAGQNAGAFTSPHLERVEERIGINGHPILTGDFVRLVQQIRPVVENMDKLEGVGEFVGRPTYFEILTALAMLHFDQQNVRWCVLEVGLGGRLDSTNVCRPLVTVITSISLDHTIQLGSKLGDIAREKAGILKPHVPLVSGVASGEARVVIQRIAEQLGCEIHTLGEDFYVQYQPVVLNDTGSVAGRLDYQDSETEYHDLPLQLPGSHQAANAAIAIKVIRLLRPYGIELHQQQFGEALETVDCPARNQIIFGQPSIVLDTAHNVASIQALLEVLAVHFPERQRVFIFATTRGKPLREMLRHLLEEASILILTQYVENPRGYTLQELSTIVGELRLAGEIGDTTQVHIVDNPSKAWQLAKSKARLDGILCVTGSFFLAAELLDTIRTQGCVVNGR